MTLDRKFIIHVETLLIGLTTEKGKFTSSYPKSFDGRIFSTSVQVENDFSFFLSEPTADLQTQFYIVKMYFSHFLILPRSSGDINQLGSLINIRYINELKL